MRRARFLCASVLCECELPTSPRQCALQVLWDALFFKQSRTWTKMKVANLNCDETPNIGRFFLLGMDLGKQPLFDGLCACCATLLHGQWYDNTANTNWKPGPPMDRFGEKLLTPDGRSDTNAQPPCFHRFSPRLFAQARS